MNKSQHHIVLFCALVAFAFAGCTENINTASQTPSKTVPAAQVQSLNTQESEQAQPSGVITNGSRFQKMIALTFDADMTPGMLAELKNGKVKSWYNEQVIQNLESHQTPATLFLTGMWAETYPDQTKSFAQNPLFELENHSYDHAAFNLPCYGLPHATNKEGEVQKPVEIISTLTGLTPKYFRFPGGCFDENDVKIVEKLGMQVVEWDVVSGDSYLKDARKIVKQVLKSAQNGSIIVMHLNGGPHAPATAVALPGIIDGLKKKGFTFVKLSQLLS